MFKPQTFSNAEHGFIYFNDNTLYGFGDNSYGQLGLGHNNTIDEPEIIMKDKDIVKIICSNSNTLILKSDGSIYISGICVGLKDKYHIFNFTLVYQDENIKDVVFNRYNICLLMINNTLKIIRKDKIVDLPFENIQNIFIINYNYHEYLYLYMYNDEIHNLLLANNTLSKAEYFKTIPNLKDIFYINYKLCVITNKAVELHTGNNVEIKYNGDIDQVFANDKKIILRKDSDIHEIYIDELPNFINVIQKLVSVQNEKLINVDKMTYYMFANAL